MQPTDIASYFFYWGKAQKKELDNKGDPYHLLPFHSLDVAAVGWYLLDPEQDLCRSLAQELDVSPAWLRSWFCFCLALHDLGKFSRAFQGLAPDLSADLVKAVPNVSYFERHDSLGFALWNELLDQKWLDAIEEKIKPSYLSVWLEIVTGHHGMPPKTDVSIKNYFLPEDQVAAYDFVMAAHKLFLADVSLTPLETKKLNKAAKALSWQLAGLTVLCDWTGSNQFFFKYDKSQTQSIADYWNKAKEAAKNAVKEMPLSGSKVEPYQSVQDLFPFISEPTPLQSYASLVQLLKAPQILILEDVTGAGKTEAALILVQRLMSLGLAKGVYIALPTMATSGGMYDRMAKSYRRLYSKDSTPSLVLAHGASRYVEAFVETIRLIDQEEDKQYKDEMTASAYCSAWVADSRKKCLFADVGVGTLDQALLSVLPARHQSLRLLGLKDKILLVDEVHAYDEYMQTLLKALLEAHARQGGSVILLSATIPTNMRKSLLEAYHRGLTTEYAKPKLEHTGFPLVTHFPVQNPESEFEKEIGTREQVKRDVYVQRLGDLEQVYDLIEKSVLAGKCVCWIRNTVGNAKTAYSELEARNIGSQDKRLLFHSRFAMIDRQGIEDRCKGIFGKGELGEGQDRRTGQILVATQVVEQSLDLDFDVLISDIAPIDLMIQRAGRLHRHCRDAHGNLMEESEASLQLSRMERSKPYMYVVCPDAIDNPKATWLKPLLPDVQYVYADLGKLWLSARVLFSNSFFSMPKDARYLINSIYSEEAIDIIPEELQTSTANATGEDSAKRGIALLNALNLKKGYCRESGTGWDEDIHVPTRLTDETYTLALAKIVDGELLPYAQDETKSLAQQWMMSCLTLRENDWKAAEKNIAPEWKNKIEELKKVHKFLKWVEVFPLSEGGYSEVIGWVG